MRQQPVVANARRGFLVPVVRCRSDVSRSEVRGSPQQRRSRATPGLRALASAFSSARGPALIRAPDVGIHRQRQGASRPGRILSVSATQGSSGSTPLAEGEEITGKGTGRRASSPAPLSACDRGRAGCPHPGTSAARNSPRRYCHCADEKPGPPVAGCERVAVRRSRLRCAAPRDGLPFGGRAHRRSCTLAAGGF